MFWIVWAELCVCGGDLALIFAFRLKPWGPWEAFPGHGNERFLPPKEFATIV